MANALGWLHLIYTLKKCPLVRAESKSDKCKYIKSRIKLPQLCLVLNGKGLILDETPMREAFQGRVREPCRGGSRGRVQGVRTLPRLR